MSQQIDNWFMMQPEAFRKRLNQVVEALAQDVGQRSTVQEILCNEIIMAEDRAYKRGIVAAASFAGEFDNQDSGTKHSFESIILGKFNLIPKRKMKKLTPVKRK